MAFFLFQGRYSREAVQAMIKNPTDRSEAAAQAVSAAGGTLRNFFFAFGKSDFVCLIEAPDDSAMAACALAVSASGALAEASTTKLMPMNEALEAMRKAGEVAQAYRPPTA